ncbi:ABC transporter permease [Streptomyces albireticuli]|uniref:Transport permease protein n=1 Tax=Streptomyces albireticuli TaxID=1940 RepID=A0A2A2DH90_9ACTN|nr:ABC transporter permease [Streptomyces albireticuli]MCD9195214.1 ABC transporter permease [Streptomyces albireticuli]PAU50769.1 ABC transporter [Streptomyces albireticuli]
MGDGALGRIAALVRQDGRLLVRDPSPLIVRTVMPLLLMSFMQPLFRAALRADDVRGATGAEQGVPGMAVMFLFFLVNIVGFAMFREHGWHTWDRLRAGPARPFELVAGRLVVPLVVAVVQLAVVFAAGGLLFGLRVTGSYAALVLVGVPLALCVVMVGMALVALCRTIAQLSVFANLLALLFAGLGGALTPRSALPDWARPLAPGVPSYWAMRGFSAVILDGGGVGAVLLPAGVLCAFAAGLTAVTLFFFRAEHRKLSWS